VPHRTDPVVFSVEHPVYSAPTKQKFETSDNGDRFWPLDNYLAEGERVRNSVEHFRRC
jgi:hypothetical protein